MKIQVKIELTPQEIQDLLWCIDVQANDYYAVLTTTNYGFYYGYEFDKKETNDYTEDIWGFEVCDEEKIGAFRISYEEMSKYENCPDQWECEKCLLFGIGLWLENNKKVSRET